MKKIKVRMNKPTGYDYQYWALVKHSCMNFGMIILNQSIGTMQNYATWIQIASLLVLKLSIFMKILQIMLKNDLIHQIIKSTDQCLKKRINKL